GAIAKSRGRAKAGGDLIRNVKDLRVAVGARTCFQSRRPAVRESFPLNLLIAPACFQQEACWCGGQLNVYVRRVDLTDRQADPVSLKPGFIDGDSYQGACENHTGS